MSEEQRNDLINEAVLSMNNILKNKELSRDNMEKWKLNVATAEEIERDVDIPKKVEIINTPLKDNLIVRAVVGHASSGHCAFKKNPRTNTTLDDVIDSQTLMDSDDFFEQSQVIIDTIGKLAQKSVSRKPLVPTTMNGKPLFGVSVYNQHLPLSLLKGLFWGGYFDNYDVIRKEAEKLYGLKIGGGTTRLIHGDIIGKLNIGVDELSSGNFNYEILNQLSFDERLCAFEKIGLLMKEKKVVFDGVENFNDVKAQCVDYFAIRKEYRQEYLRNMPGSGVSDDFACMLASFIEFNPQETKNLGLSFKSKINGANIADLADTITKASLSYAPEGFDEVIGKFANHLYRERITQNKKYRKSCGISDKQLEKMLEDPDFMLVSRDEIIDLVALSVNPMKSLFDPLMNSDKAATVHSSARYFLKEEVDEKEGIDSYMLEQEMIRHYKNINIILKKRGLKEMDIRSFFSTDRILPGLRIGYNRTPFEKAFSYMKKVLLPIASLPPEDRREQIHKLYQN